MSFFRIFNHQGTRRPQHRDFNRFWLAATLSNLGDGVRLAALPLLAVEITSDARLIAAVGAMSFAPWVLVGPMSGVLVDRCDRRLLMVAAQLSRMAAIFALAISLAISGPNIYVLLGVAFLVGAGETVVDTAAQAAVPNLVDDRHLERANARLSVAEYLWNDVIGIAVGAALFAWSTALPFHLNAAAFLVGALLLAGIDRPFQKPRAPLTQPIRRQVSDGVRFVRKDPFLWPLALSVAATNVALHMGAAVLVLLVVGELGASPATYGAVLALGAAGGVVGSVSAKRLLEILTPRTILQTGHVLFVLSAVFYLFAFEVWVVSIAMALMSAARVLYQVSSRVLRQRATPDAIHGRVVTAFRMVGLSGPVLGAVVGGLVTEQFSIRYTYGASIVIIIVAWGLVLQASRHIPSAPRL